MRLELLPLSPGLVQPDLARPPRLAAGVGAAGPREGRQPEFSRDHDRVKHHVGRFAEDFNLSTIDLDGVPAVMSPRGAVMAVLHPFEDLSPESSADRVCRIRAARPEALFTSIFDVMRRPGWVGGW